MTQQPYRIQRYRRWAVLCSTFIFGLLLLMPDTVWASEPVDAGYRTLPNTCNSSPTGEKPESKLWFHDGVWWGSLCHAASKTYHIYRFDVTSQDWFDTQEELDDRSGTKSDILWDESDQKLYVASHVFTNSGSPTSTSSNWARLYRYSYNAGNRRYTLDSGFPVTITRGRSETIALDKDSTGTLWVTFVESSKVMVNHSRNGDDADWGIPYALSLTGASNLSSDDISSVISMGDRIGVMWSNQKTDIMYFATHLDSDANDQNWQSANAYAPGGNASDDHINLKSLQADPAGRVFAVTKTSYSSSGQPLLVLHVCQASPCNSNQWQAYTVSRTQENDTRPIVLIDTDNRNLHVFMTGSGSGGEILHKVTSLDNIQFSIGEGDVFIKNSGDLKINNSTSTKQNVNRTTGILVAASSQTTLYYYHNYIDLGGGPTPTPPIITSFAPTSGDVGSQVTLFGSRFTGATAVYFNGVAATFTVISDTEIHTVVPAGATSGPLRVTTPQGTGFSTNDFTVNPAPPSNQPPSVQAGNDQTVTLPAGASLAAVVNDDGLPNPPAALTLQWSMTSGPNGSNVVFGNPTAANTSAAFSLAGVYVLRLTANDSALSAWDELTVTVNPAPPSNQPPSVQAGNDQTVTLPAGASLAAVVNDDGLPNPPAALTLQWSMTSGPNGGNVVFGNPTAANTSAAFSLAGVYVLRLTANDSALSAWDELTVTVNPAPPGNQPPSVQAGNDQTVTLPAGASLAAVVNDDGLPNPPAALTLQWSMTSGPNGGNVVFGNPTAANTSAAFSLAGVYVLRLTANDSALSAWDELTVTVNPAPPGNQPPSVQAGNDQTVTLPAGASLAAVVNDDGLPNPPAALTLQWSMTSGPNGSNVVFGNPAAANTSAAFSLAGVYVLRLTANDSALSAWDELTVTVNPAPPGNQPPSVQAGNDQTVTLPAGASLAAVVNDDGLPNPPAALTLQWSMTSGPNGSNVVFGNPAAANTSAAFSLAGVYVLRLTANDSALSAWDELTVTVNPAPAASGNTLFISLAGSATISGLSVRDDDILGFDTDTDTWAMYFDGSDVGVGGTDLNAFELLANGSILMSFNTNVTAGGLAVTPVDIVRFIPTQLGPNTAGTFTWFFRGASVGLANTSSNVIDALTLTGDGGLLLSTAGSFSVPGVSGRDEDLLLFTPNQAGDYSSGAFSLFFDGSDVGLSESADEDIWDVWQGSGNNELYLTTKGAFSVPGLSGDAVDIFICTPGSLGANTDCTYRLFWDGSTHGLTGEVVDGFSIDQGGKAFSAILADLHDDIDHGPDNILDENESEFDDPDDSDLSQDEVIFMPFFPY